jgi:hypothetical protein
VTASRISTSACRPISRDRVAGLHAADPYDARVRWKDAEHQVDGGGFAGSVASEEGHHLTRGDREVEPVDRSHLPVRVADAAQVDGGGCLLVHVIDARSAPGRRADA